MTTAPTWQVATSGQSPLANHVNQLLGPHAMTLVYQGSNTSTQTTNGSTTTSTNGLWLAQSFTTTASQTTIGSVTISLTTTTTSGSSLAPTVVSIYGSSGGAPSGSPLVSTTMTAEYAYNSSGGVNTTRIGVPLPVTGLTPSTTYWIVAQAAGNVSNRYTWFRSNQTSGASTSPDGVTWTAQSYGFTYTVMDTTVTGLLKATWEDNGARWLWFVYNSNGELSALHEYTAGQTGSGYLQSDRQLTYANNSFLSTIA